MIAKIIYIYIYAFIFMATFNKIHNNMIKKKLGGKEDEK